MVKVYYSWEEFVEDWGEIFDLDGGGNFLTQEQFSHAIWDGGKGLSVWVFAEDKEKKYEFSAEELDVPNYLWEENPPFPHNFLDVSIQLVGFDKSKKFVPNSYGTYARLPDGRIFGAYVFWGVPPCEEPSEMDELALIELVYSYLFKEYELGFVK